MTVGWWSRGLASLALHATVLAAPAAIAAAQESALGVGLDPVPFERVELGEGPWKDLVRRNARVTLPHALARCEANGLVANFAIAGGLEQGEHRAEAAADSEVYKLLEGIAYSLAIAPDAELEARADAIVTMIAAAQGEDGYVNTWTTLVEPERRWASIRHGLELFCAGHLIEAGLAYSRATGKRALLDVATRFADLIEEEFGPDGRPVPPGHPEIELALIALSRATGEYRYQALAQLLVERRGDPSREHRFGEYAQDAVPILRSRTAAGHAVRATYLYCAIADLARATGYEDLRVHALTHWDDVFRRKMYVTGGVGADAAGEGFGREYELPNYTAYGETCASIGLALWNQRLFLLTAHPAFPDVVERATYNHALAGVSLAGDTFFQADPLGSLGGLERRPWFAPACCPTNAVRFVPSMLERVWAHDARNVYLAQFVASRADVAFPDGMVRITLETDFPRSGKMRFVVEPAWEREFTLHVRVPGWCENEEIRSGVNEEMFRNIFTHGHDPGLWMKFERTWKPGDVLLFDLPLVPQRVRADERVEADRGRVCLQRGPEVFAFEALDHGGHVRNLCLPPDARLRAVWEPELLGGTHVIRAQGLALSEGEEGQDVLAPVELTAIPYRLWGNRGAGEMLVWIPEDPALCAFPGETERHAARDRIVRASHCDARGRLSALVDEREPLSSHDARMHRMSFRGRVGGEEWVRYDFAAPRALDRSAVYWLDEGEGGQVRAPAGWSLELLSGQEWKGLTPTEGAYGVEVDRWNEVRFAGATTRSIRLRVRQREDASAGLLEWTVGPQL